MPDVLVSLQKLTAPVAIILATAWVITNKTLSEGIMFLIAAGIFYVIIVFIEWQIYCDNEYNGRGR
jgi:hypothetical protein